MDVRTFGSGLFVGISLVICGDLWRESYFAPSISYVHDHVGTSYLNSKSKVSVKGAAFDGESFLLGYEPPMPFKAMMEEAVHDFERYKFMDQQNCQIDTPVSKIEIRVWR